MLLAMIVAVPAGSVYLRSGAYVMPPAGPRAATPAIGHPESAALVDGPAPLGHGAARQLAAAGSTARIAPAVFNNSWVDITPLSPVAPPPLAGAAMVFDPSNSWIILFGGLSDTLGPTNYTWIFFDWTWTNITLDYPSAPSPRYYASIAYDSYLNAVVLYGGQSSGSTFLGDTWEFSPVTGWSQWHTATGSLFGPPARAGAMMAYDAGDNYVLLFGGYNGSIYLGETWTWDGNTWTQLTLTPSPPGREWGTLTWYPNIGALVLFGGSAYSLTTAFNDTWLFFTGNWTAAPSLPSPVDRELAGAAFDGSTHQVLLFGGEHPDGCNLLGDTWTYAAGLWQELPLPGPNARWGPAMAFDPVHGYVVLFGGEVGSCSPSVGVNDTWVYGPWNTSNPPGPLTISDVPDRTTGAATLTVNFAATAKGGIAGYTYIWSWGDGSGSTALSDGSSESMSHPFTRAGNFVVDLHVVDSASHSADVSLTISVGSVVVGDWLPPRDTYSFSNYGSFWSADGNCYGVSSSEILYWEHDILGWPNTPLLPSPAPETSGLGNPVDAADFLNATTLAIMAHQVYDPSNSVGDLSPGSFASTWSTLLGLLQKGEVAILGLGPTHLHAVVLYGEQTWPNGTIEMAISDPNFPLVTRNAWYYPSLEKFNYTAGVSWPAFDLTGSPDPQPLRSDWFFPLPVVDYFGWQDFPPTSLGNTYVVADTPVTVTNLHGSDSFGVLGDSQSFTGSIPGSFGISERSVELFRLPFDANAPPTVVDPSAGTTRLALLNSSGSNASLQVEGFGLSLDSGRSHLANLTAAENGWTLSVGSVPLLLNLSVYRVTGNASDALTATDLPLPSDSTVTLRVDDWAGLNSSTVSSATLSVAPAGGAPQDHALRNGQIGLGSSPPPTPPTNASKGSSPFPYADFGLGVVVGAGGIGLAALLIRGRSRQRPPPPPAAL